MGGVAEGAPQALTGALLDNPPIVEFLEGLRVELTRRAGGDR